MKGHRRSASALHVLIEAGENYARYKRAQRDGAEIQGPHQKMECRIETSDLRFCLLDIRVAEPTH